MEGLTELYGRAEFSTIPMPPTLKEDSICNEESNGNEFCWFSGITEIFSVLVSYGKEYVSALTAWTFEKSIAELLGMED